MNWKTNYLNIVPYLSSIRIWIVSLEFQSFLMWHKLTHRGTQIWRKKQNQTYSADWIYCTCMMGLPWSTLCDMHVYVSIVWSTPWVQVKTNLLTNIYVGRIIRCRPRKYCLVVFIGLFIPNYPNPYSAQLCTLFSNVVKSKAGIVQPAVKPM